MQLLQWKANSKLPEAGCIRIVVVIVVWQLAISPGGQTGRFFANEPLVWGEGFTH